MTPLLLLITAAGDDQSILIFCAVIIACVGLFITSALLLMVFYYATAPVEGLPHDVMEQRLNEKYPTDDPDVDVDADEPHIPWLG